MGVLALFSSSLGLARLSFIVLLAIDSFSCSFARGRLLCELFTLLFDLLAFGRRSPSLDVSVVSDTSSVPEAEFVGRLEDGGEAGEEEEDVAGGGGGVVGKPIKGCCLGSKAELMSPMPTMKSSVRNTYQLSRWESKLG